MACHKKTLFLWQKWKYERADNEVIHINIKS